MPVLVHGLDSYAVDVIAATVHVLDLLGHTPADMQWLSTASYTRYLLSRTMSSGCCDAYTHASRKSVPIRSTCMAPWASGPSGDVLTFA